MAQETQFRIGAEATCSDGVCGEVTRVVVDPVARAVTHLVVDPKHGGGLGRLVPLEVVDATSGEVRLRCTSAEFKEFDPAEETQFLSGTGGSGYGGYGPGQTLAWPYYGLGGRAVMGVGAATIDLPVTYEKVPAGEVAVHRGDRVHAADGDIGRVQGVVIDPSDHHVTHVLLQEGHLWGRKQVTIPINVVTSVEDGIRLKLTKQDVEDLPELNIDQPNI